MKSKFLLSVLLVIVMTMSVLPMTAFASSYSDVDGHWAQSSIARWSDYGVILGSNGKFKPDAPITRGEMAVILDRIMKYQAKASNGFPDLDQSFYTDAVLKANAAGIIKGDGIKVRPKDSISRQEASVMICRALGINAVSGNTGFNDDIKIASWSKGYVKAMYQRGFIKGVGENNFSATDSITRAGVVKILDNAVSTFYNKAGEYTTNASGTVIINTPDVVLKNMEIKGDLIIAEGVGNGDVKLDNIKILGNTIVKGGGKNSLYFNSVTVEGALVVNKVGGDLRIVATGTTSVSVATLESGAIIVTKDLIGGGIEKVEIPASIATGQNVVLVGNFKTVENNAANINVQATGEIESLILNEKATIIGGATISNITVVQGADSVVNGKPVTGGQTNDTTQSSGGGGGGSSTVLNPVTNSVGPGASPLTYNGNAIDLSTISGLFTIDSNAGAAIYSLETIGSPTGTGSIATDGRNLIVTKAGSFTVGLRTVATSTYAAGEKITASLTVNKGSQLAPSAPTTASIGATVVTLTSSTGCEFSSDGVNWQTSPVFTGLIANTQYTFYQRMMATDLYNASPSSAGLNVTTNAEEAATTFTVTFNSNGGSEVAPITGISINSTITPPADPAKNAPDNTPLTFLGWHKDVNLTDDWDFANDTVTASITLFAKWSGWSDPLFVDSRFAVGYPKARVVDGKIQIDIKLAEPTPTDVYMIVNQMNGNFIGDVEAVMHGHSGTNGQVIYVDEYPFISIPDNLEHTINTDVTVTGQRDIKIQFVLANPNGTEISTQTTLIEFNQVTVAELDAFAPDFTNAYINAEKNKIYLHFDEELDTASVPDASCFTLTNSGGIAVSTVSVLNSEGSLKKGYVVLNLSGAISDVTNLMFSYFPPSDPTAAVLQDKATTPNKVEGLTERDVKVATLSAGSVFVSADGQYLNFTTTNSYYLFNSGYPSFTLKYGVDSANANIIQTSEYTKHYSYANNGSYMEFSIKLNSPPVLIDGGKYYIDLAPNGCTDFAFDAGAVITNAEGTPANEQALGDPTAVVYNIAADTITVTFDNNKLSSEWNTSIYDCFFSLNIGGRNYDLRGRSFLNVYDGTLVIDQKNVPFNMTDAVMNDATLSVSTANHANNIRTYYYLTYPSGKPYEGFSNIPILIQ